MVNSNNKALERGGNIFANRAFKDAYNPKNREFTYGGKTIKIPTQLKEEDIKNLCLCLMGKKSLPKSNKAMEEAYNSLIQVEKKQEVIEDEPSAKQACQI